jgi:hypothetical protein
VPGPDFKSGWGRQTVPGGFDSHPPPPKHPEVTAMSRAAAALVATVEAAAVGSAGGRDALRQRIVQRSHS